MSGRRPASIRSQGWLLTEGPARLETATDAPGRYCGCVFAWPRVSVGSTAAAMGKGVVVCVAAPPRRAPRRAVCVREGGFVCVRLAGGVGGGSFLRAGAAGLFDPPAAGGVT